MQEDNDARFFLSNTQQFSVRSSILLIHRQSLLLENDDPEVYVPGGAIHFNETAEQAILREAQEELGIALSGPEFAGVLESFWDRDTMQFHQLTMVFRQRVDDVLFNHLQHLNYDHLDVSAQAKMVWYPLTEAARIIQPRKMITFTALGTPLRHEVERD
ncbi:MAG: NUDIX domain-containing protein [Schleiferilactobacillus perolens]|uniref:NUDIX domain-containing protein n=1 Tax=Schleiferilactobacillus perolens TaxID=100468 RepID=UPI0039E7BC7C